MTSEQPLPDKKDPTAVLVEGLRGRIEPKMLEPVFFSVISVLSVNDLLKLFGIQESFVVCRAQVLYRA